VKRLLWLDVAKGLAILIVVYFHFFSTFFEHGALPPPDWSTVAAGLTTFLGIAWLKVSGYGFHAVGAFIILSGWALMESTARRAAAARCPGAPGIARVSSAFIRCIWVAHLVYLVSPFVARLEPVDSRIFLSLLGLRFIDITMNFMYLNAAWWYFSMLIQFYLLFPLFFWAARKLGPWPFLLLSCAVGFLVRYLMLVPYPQNGLWILGGCAICRLPEFALGMTLGMWHSQSATRVEKFLLRGPGLLTGLLLYPGALWLFHSGFTYTFVDLATGACALLVILGVAGIISISRARPKFSLWWERSLTASTLCISPTQSGSGSVVREAPLWMLFFITVATLAALSAWGIILEKTTNTALNKLMPARAKKPRDLICETRPVLKLFDERASWPCPKPHPASTAQSAGAARRLRRPAPHSRQRSG
jgi:peptidoglycan/LPS O-acetylase OafA/YrhL